MFEDKIKSGRCGPHVETSLDYFKPRGSARVCVRGDKRPYLSSAVGIVRVPFFTLQQSHMGEVLYWICKSEEDLALLENKKSIFQTGAILLPRSTQNDSHHHSLFSGATRPLVPLHQSILRRATDLSISVLATYLLDWLSNKESQHILVTRPRNSEQGLLSK